MPRPKDWDAPTDLRSAAREAGIKPDWSDPDFLGFVEEQKWNQQEYNAEWKRENIAAERERQKSGTHETAKEIRRDWSAAVQPSKPREIKPLPPRDPNNDRDRER